MVSRARIAEGIDSVSICLWGGLSSGEELLAGGERRYRCLSSGVDRLTGEQHNERNPISDQSRFTGEQRSKRVSPNIRGVLTNQLSTPFCGFR